MAINTANIIGRYAILKKPGHRPKHQSSLTEAIDEGFSEHRRQVKKAAKVVSDKADTESDKLIDITMAAHDNLITAKTVFPFAMFPDTVSIDRQKLTITHRSFFQTSTTISIQIDDVQIAKADVGPFFGTVHLASKYFADNIQTINFLRRDDAIKIQRLLQGYMIAQSQGIDCASIEDSQLVILLDELGQSSTS